MAGVNAAIGIGIVGNNQSGILKASPSEVLDLTNDIGVVVHVISHGTAGAPACNLYQPHGEIFIAKDPSPIGDYCRKGAVKGFPAGAKGIVFALIKEGTGNSHV